MATTPEPTVATLTFESDVPDTSVFVDRRYLGKTPLTTTDVAPGEHHINLSPAGYDPHVETITVAPGERTEDYWDYRPENGENYRDVEVRLAEFAQVLKGPSVVVAHGGIARTLRVLIEHAPIIEVINWAPPQDAIMHFTPGKMELIRADDV